MSSTDDQSDSESDSSDSSFSWDEAYNFELIDVSTKKKYNTIKSKSKSKKKRLKRKHVNKKEETVNPTPNAIIHFIKLCRTITTCNASQLQQFMSQMINIFDKSNKNNILKNILLNGLRSHYKAIPLQLYQKIDTIDNIHPKIRYDDSFPNDEDDNEQQIENKESISHQEIPKTLLTIPKDVLCYNLNFLHIKDIFSISKVCRYLSVISYDGNSIYHLTFPGIIDFIHCSIHSKYSKIKSLTLNTDFPGHSWSKEHFAKMCQHWNKLECLKICGKEYTVWTHSYKPINIFESIKRYFPSVLNLKTLTLSNTIIDTKFMNTNINQTMLQYLSLNDVTISFKMIQCLMKFTNLKRLCLKNVTRNWKTNDNFCSLLLRNKKYIGTMYPFSVLTEFETDSSMICEQVIDVINWILMNGIRKKTFVLNMNNMIRPFENNELHSRLMVSFGILNELQLNIYQQTSIYPFTSDTKFNNLNYFKVHSTSIMPTVQKVIDNIIKYSKLSMVSELICNSKSFEWFEKWILSHCKQQSKFFATINFNLVNKTKMYDEKYNHDRDGYELSHNGKQIIAKHILKEFQTIEWFLNRSDNKEKLRKIGVRHISVNINHTHKHKVENEHGWDLDDFGYGYECAMDEEYDKVTKGLDNDATFVSRRCVNQYINTKLKKLSEKKKFEYQQNDNNFLFNYEIDVLASSDSDTNDESDSDSDD